MLDVPRELVLFVSGLLAARRRQIGTRKGTRKLGCYRRALFGLAWFRDNGGLWMVSVNMLVNHCAAVDGRGCGKVDNR